MAGIIILNTLLFNSIYWDEASNPYFSFSTGVYHVSVLFLTLCIVPISIAIIFPVYLRYILRVLMQQKLKSRADNMTEIKRITKAPASAEAFGDGGSLC